MDNSEQREQQDSIVPDLPSIDKLAAGDASEKVGSLEDTLDSEAQLRGKGELEREVKDRMEETKDEQNEETGEKEVGSDVGGDTSSEKKVEGKQSLSK